MEYLTKALDVSSIARRNTVLPDRNNAKNQTNGKYDPITKIEFGQKRKRPVDDSEERLTNDRSTIFMTKSQKATLTGETEIGWKRKMDISKNIHSKVKKLYKERLDETENHRKIVKAWSSVLPKIDILIRDDKENVNSENKIKSGEYQTKRAVGYFCASQLFVTSSSKLPSSIQENLIEDIESDNYEPIYGVIPEIDIAFTVSGKVFNYWNLSSQANIVDSIELSKQIVSVGLVKPPQGFFQTHKCENLIFLGSDHKLIVCEVTFKNQYSKGKTTKIEQLDIAIPWENIHYEKVVWTSDSRIFVGWKDAKLNEVEFNITKTWFWNNTKKTIQTKNKADKTGFFSSLIPNFFKFSEKEMDTIEIDEARHIIYTLSFREFNEKEDIKPCNIDVYHLGAFGKGISKVTSISQFQLVKEIQKFNKSKEEDSIQIVGLHSVNITESDTIHFVLTTSKGLRIYVSLSVENYLDEKIRELKGFDYTTYHNERPDGEWRIVGIFNPPLPKDIIGFTKDQERCCSDFSFVNQESWVIKSFYSKGSIFLNGINTSNDRKVLLYINDSEAWIKNTGDHSYRHSVSEKFWAIKIPEDVYLLEIQKKPLELYVDEDVLNCIGYFKKKTMSESINIKKNKHNLYINSKKHIYSEQIYLPGEEFILMNSNEILTISKVIF